MTNIIVLMTLNDIIVLETITSGKLIKSHYLIGFTVQKHAPIHKKQRIGTYVYYYSLMSSYKLYDYTKIRQK